MLRIGISQSRANQKATEEGREHELKAEHESQFAPEDTVSNALGAVTNKGLAATPLAGAVFEAFKRTLTTCGPIDFTSLSQPSQDKIVKFYSATAPDPKPQKPGGQIPLHQNQTAIPEIPDIPECGSRERSFPFGLDSDDPDRKTLSSASFEKGSTDMTSSKEIRNFVFTQRPEVILRLSVSEKIRMLRVLLSDEVSEEDKAAAKIIHDNSTPEDYQDELDAISFRVRPLEGATLHVDIPPPTYDEILLPLLEQQFSAPDQTGPGQRVEKLRDFFAKLGSDDAKRLYTRLKARRTGDKVAYLFHHVLHPDTRERLLKVLQH